ncbi:MAG: hypothetical protein AB7O73_07190 [Bacteroidia bacterium]
MKNQILIKKQKEVTMTNNIILSLQNNFTKMSHLNKFHYLVLLTIIVSVSYCQTNVDNTFQATSEFQPVIKESVKFSELPEIVDTVKRIKNLKYGIVSNPLFPKYSVQTIESAKMKNEPLQKLYHSYLKVGYAPLYTTPYGEFFITNTRSRKMAYGAKLKHFSSTGKLDSTGTADFSDNEGSIFAKKFYHKHTLYGDLSYKRNVVHYYGYNTLKNQIDEKNKDFTRQRYQLIEPKIKLQSHFKDSSDINHVIDFAYYNLQNLHREAENNIKLHTDVSTFLNHEKLNVGLYADYYNHKQSTDTINDLIVSLAPSFEASGKKWHATVGLQGTLDNFRSKTKFYFYPKLDFEYDIYEHLIVPFVGVNGGLTKNSMRSLSDANPFLDTTFQYTNSNTKYKVYGGLKGNLSTNTSYYLEGSYSKVDSMMFFVLDYSGLNQMYNRFDAIYDNTTMINVKGSVQYQLREKIKFMATGNYYLYQTENLERAYHRPDYDLTLSFLYNLKSKFIIRTDIYTIGKQWSYTPVFNATLNKTEMQSQQLKGLIDANIELEYRYSSMLSFFTRFSNIANQRYYRWERYPSQRFNFMIGLTFVPF